LSECASSVFDGDDLGEVSAPEPVPEKKKRPPRKKKKKKQDVPPLETTEEGNEKENKATDVKGTDGEQKVAGKAAQEEKKSGQSPNEDEPDVVSDTKPQSSLPLDTKEAKTDESNKPPQAPSVNDSAAANNATLTKSLNPNAKAWGTNLPQASATKPSPSPQAKHVKSKPAETPTYTPKPGSWASMAVGKGSSHNNIQRAAAQSPPTRAPPVSNRANKQTNGSILPPPESPRSPPKDWTKHVVSPRSKVRPSKGTMNINHIPPPPMAKQEQNVWPTLGDFPPPPGAAKTNIEKPKQTKPMGAWGKAKH